MKLTQVNKKFLVIAVAIVSLIGFWFWRKSSTQIQYEEYLVTESNIEDTLELSGQVQAESSATLRFSLGGNLTYLGAKEGDLVKKWQTLASIDSRQLKKVLDQKLNLYAIQRNTFDQTIDDNDNSVPDGDLANTLKRLLDQNQYRLENTVLDVEYQDLAVKLASIHSPIDGILVHSPVTVSNVQAAATDTWVVVDPNTLEFTADLDETDISKVKEGQKVEVILDAYPDEIITSSISSISYAPKETTTGTTYEIKIALPAEKMAMLRLGLNGTASVILEEKLSVISIPTTTLSLLDGSSAVTILKDGEYVQQPIKTGVENNGIVEVLGGLEVGQHVYVEK